MTVLASYRESQKLINEAEALVRAGEEGKARPLFARAAQAEWEFVHDLSQEKVRSRAIFGFSAADYYLRAGQLDEAEKVAAFLLEQASLEPYSHEVVRRFLGRVWDERMLRISHLQIEGSYFSVLLRDGEVGYGLAPFDVIERAMRLGWGYLNRFAAFLVDIDWTRKLPIDAIQERYRAFVAPA